MHESRTRRGETQDSPRTAGVSPAIRHGEFGDPSPVPCTDPALAVARRGTHRGRGVACRRDRRPRRDVLSRPALPPALARAPRAVAGRGGVALPVVGARLPARRSTSCAGWPQRAAATCSPSASPRCSPPSSTTRTACAARTRGSAAGCCAPTAPRPGCPTSPRTSTAPPPRALDTFETHWRHGASPLLRSLADVGALELLGGPATHPFGPLLLPQMRAFALETGLADAALRLGTRPAGIWAPECGYAPGMEDGLRRGGRAPVPRRRPRAARRHSVRPARRRVGRRRVRPRPGRHLPRVVAALGLPRRPRLPRLPHLRPPLRPQARPRHRPLRRAARQAALRPRPRRRGGRAGRRGLRVGRPRAAGWRCGSGTVARR